jgi:hypothetical protein
MMPVAEAWTLVIPLTGGDFASFAALAIELAAHHGDRYSPAPSALKHDYGDWYQARLARTARGQDIGFVPSHHLSAPSGGYHELERHCRSAQRVPGAYTTGSWTLACHTGTAVAGAVAGLKGRDNGNRFARTAVAATLTAAIVGPMAWSGRSCRAPSRPPSPPRGLRHGLATALGVWRAAGSL